MTRKLTPEEQDQYMPFLEKFDMTEKQKRDYIDTMWEFLEQQADLAFGINDAQLISEKTGTKK